MIVLDTTVLTYAVGTEHHLREPCRRLLAAHGGGLVEATTTVEVIQEFVHVRARRRSRADAAALARHYATAFALLVTRAEDLDLGLSLYEQYPDLGAFDAVLAAVALNRQAQALVSADRAFGVVPGLPWVDPATEALDRLIGH
ncbi:MAG: type II toxin-antitoxin system VapC family toxin [Chloroflexi bacterium]|nr:type II toxin-antitoxin system VapC family toxin [Chloroflexota bacterium]